MKQTPHRLFALSMLLAAGAVTANAGEAQLDNTGFEFPVTNTVLYNPVTPAWQFEGTAGIIGNGWLTALNAPAPEGRQVAFLQGQGAIHGHASGMIAGHRYMLKFKAARRAGTDPNFIMVTAGGGSVLEFSPDSSLYQEYTTIPFFASITWPDSSISGGNLDGALAGDAAKVGLNGINNEYPNDTFFDDIQIVSLPDLVPDQDDLGFERPATNGSIDLTPDFGYVHPNGNSFWTYYHAGVCANGAGYARSNPPAPQGKQVAFLEPGGARISTMLTGLHAGDDYVLNLKAAQSATNPNSQFIVECNGAVIGTFRPSGADYDELSTRLFTATSDRAVISIVSVGGDGPGNRAVTLLDDVRFLAVHKNVVSVKNTKSDDLGFEQPQTGWFDYAPVSPYWTFNRTPSGGSGVSANGTALTSGNPPAPEGRQVGFIQGNGVIDGWIGGVHRGDTCTIWLKAAQRGNWNQGGQCLLIGADGNAIGWAFPRGPEFEQISTTTFTAVDDAIHLRIIGLNLWGGDNTAFVDDVQFEVTPTPPRNPG